MENTPNKIYLQVGDDADVSEDFNELYKTEITWATDQLNKNDLEFYSKDEIIKAITHAYNYAMAGTPLDKIIEKYESN